MKNIVFIVALSCNFFLLAQQEFSLEQAQNYALENNLSVKNSYLDIENAHKQSLEATSQGLPQISIQGQFSNFINLPTQVVDASFINPNAPEGETISFRAGTEYQATGTLQANQLLFNGSYFIGLQVAKFFTEVSEDAHLKSQEDVVFNVTQAYQIATVGKENLQFVDSMFILTKKLVEDQRQYHELKLISNEDMDQLEYSLLSVETARTSAEIQLKNALTLLKLTMGHPMKDSIAITATTEELISRASLKEQSQGSLSENLQYKMLENQMVLSEYNLKNYKATQYPTLSAFFQHNYNAFRNEFNFFADEQWYPQTLWGINLNIPIISGGQKYAQIQQAKIKVLKDQNNLQLFEQKLQQEEIQHQNNLLGAKVKLQLQEKNVELATKIYKNALVKKEIGAGNSLEVTQKYNQLIQSLTELNGATIDVLSAKLNLDKLYNRILP